MKRKIPVIAVSSLLMGLVFDWLFYEKEVGISVFLFVAISLGLTIYLANYFQKSLPKPVWALLPVVLLLALAFGVRASGWLAFINGLVVLFLLLLAIKLTIEPKLALRSYTLPRYLDIVVKLPLELVRQSIAFGVAVLQSERPQKHSIMPFVRGVLLSLPVMAVFLILFSSADLVFKQYVGSLFRFSVSPDLIGHLLVIGLVTAWFIGGFGLLFWRSRATQLLRPVRARRFIGTTEAYVVLGGVQVLFVLFVLIQVAYLFGGQNHIASTGLTYAEYARRGFFELISVAVISLGLILVLERLTQRTPQQHTIFRWLNLALIVEVFVVMASAFQRLSLYEQAYGYTLLRLYSHLLLVWLAFVFVLLIAHVWRQQDTSQFAFRVFGSVIAFVLILNVINPDVVVARQNIKRFQTTGKIDVGYLMNLSEDATPVIAQLLNSSDVSVRRTTAYHLYLKHGSRDPATNNWQSFNLSRQRSHHILHQRETELHTGYNEFINQPN